MTRTAVVVGNPKPRSRTWSAGLHVARELRGGDPDLVVDLAELGGAVFEPDATHVTELVTAVASAEVVVFASPTYKGACTGLLKAFLDRFPHQGLRGVVAVPLMLGAGPGHALAVETTLRPVLTELGATVPFAGLFVLDTASTDPASYDGWLATARPVTAALTPALAAIGERTPELSTVTPAGV
jgi:FMN reductase